MERISTVIITRDEERTIADCVRSVRSFSDEILVVDSGSADATVRICRGLGCRVLTRKFDDFVRQKNFGLDRAKHDRIFFLDADERVPAELVEKILNLKKTGFDRDAYRTPRRNTFLGRRAWYGGWGSDWMYFFFDRRKCRYEGSGIHERLSTKGATLGRLGPYVLHEPYADLGHHLRKIDSYSRLFAAARISRKRPLLALDVVLRPVIRFVRCYLFQGAFLAGWRGFVFSWMASFSVFMKYARWLEARTSVRNNPGQRR